MHHVIRKKKPNRLVFLPRREAFTGAMPVGLFSTLTFVLALSPIPVLTYLSPPRPCPYFVWSNTRRFRRGALLPPPATHRLLRNDDDNKSATKLA